MKTSHPSYIVADIPEPAHSAILELRRSCCKRTDNIPAEITLAGSSGCGPIPVGTDVALVREAVADLLRGVESFKMQFSGWSVFPNTTIAYLAPSCRQMFDSLHRGLADSKIPFGSSEFPYNPHCTIGSSWSTESLERISELPFPSEAFFVSSLRFLELDNQTLECNELAQFDLPKSTSEQGSAHQPATRSESTIL